MGDQQSDYERLLTARLSLQRPTSADIDAIYRIHHDPRATAHNPADRLVTRADAEDRYRVPASRATWFLVESVRGVRVTRSTGRGKRDGTIPGVDWRGEVDTWWESRLRLPLGTIRKGGVFTLDHIDHVGVITADEARAPVVYGPANMLPLLPAVSDAGHDPDTVLAALGNYAARAIGPAWYGYVSPAMLSAQKTPHVRRLREDDLPLLARLHGDTEQAEREESGTSDLPAFGYIEGGNLLAVATLGLWSEMPTIGVLTHPRARRRGLAAAVVNAAAREGLRHRSVVQYRAWRRNEASIAVALHCGFAYYADALVVDLAT
jgi:RimJ/RimL family protein N-acetyltransferase